MPFFPLILIRLDIYLIRCVALTWSYLSFHWSFGLDGWLVGLLQFSKGSYTSMLLSEHLILHKYNGNDLIFRPLTRLPNITGQFLTMRNHAVGVTGR